jgi:Protein of unknown function (DUF3761)
MKKAIMLALALWSAVPTLSFVFPTTAAEARQGCGSGYYRNSRGRCVHRPARADRPPAGWSARCRDGTYSFSQSRRGTCSWHGGVAIWR